MRAVFFVMKHLCTRLHVRMFGNRDEWRYICREDFLGRSFFMFLVNWVSNEGVPVVMIGTFHKKTKPSILTNGRSIKANKYDSRESG